MTDPRQHIDGREVRARLDLRADVVVIGSGPAGAAAALEAARAGASVIVLEEGRWFDADDYPRAALDAMALMYRQMSASVVLGAAPIPYLQAKMVGGSSPINGAICWRLPQDVHADWLRADPALADALPWGALEALTDGIEARLNVTPTDPAVAGPKNLLMAKGAEALGLAHRPIRRNVAGCEGLGRCLQGCPKGRKRSVDATLLRDAQALGAVVLSSAEVTSIDTQGGAARGVTALTAGGGRARVTASRAVILAASAIQSPALLLKSGLRQGPVGRYFQCHPGVSMSGRFPDPVRMWEGATQGHEVTGLRHEGLKFEALGFGLGVLAGRLDGVGDDLARALDHMAYEVDWGAAIKAQAHGRVRLIGGHPVVTWTPSPADIQRFRKGLKVLGAMMLAAGADHVSPGVRGFTPQTSSLADLDRLEHSGPQSPRAFTCAITHMFGTCRMGSDPARSVVGPDLQHHAVRGLYVADSSVFPTNIGVNPQIPIMAVASLCARRALGLLPDGASALTFTTPPSHSPHPSPTAPTHAMTSTDTSPQPPSTSPTPSPVLTLDDLMQMRADQLQEVMRLGHPLDLDALAGRQFLGVDLSLPGWARKLLWHTFRKAFVRDDPSGDVRGWNVRMEQHGLDGPRISLKDRAGRPVTFGHYRVRSAAGVIFPKGWRGAHFLDYTSAGNARLDPAALGYTPLVAVNAGRQDLLLGWEIFKVGPAFLPLPLYWALRDEGPVEDIIPPPRPVR
jgi:choline dehydrogenase-like flavoprotein